MFAKFQKQANFNTPNNITDSNNANDVTKPVNILNPPTTIIQILYEHDLQTIINRKLCNNLFDFHKHSQSEQFLGNVYAVSAIRISLFRSYSRYLL